MTPLTLEVLSGNAFRILGLPAAASQAQIEAAARKMRIWPDPSMIPPSTNDAVWIGAIRRASKDIEGAVARLANPTTRIEERLCWFCQTPPETDAPIAAGTEDIAAFHDAALIDLYRALLTNAAHENRPAWEAMAAKFRALASSDDYLQWSLEKEFDGDFDKRASPEEVAAAQAQVAGRIACAVVGSLSDALAAGDFEFAAEAVYLIREDALPDTAAAGPKGRPGAGGLPAPNTAADALLDKLEDDLSSRCKALTQKIDRAWETKLVSNLRPACNHVIARFDTHIRPLIDQLLAATHDEDRRDRIRAHGVALLFHAAAAYEAIDNYLAAERTLTTAVALAGGGSMKYGAENRLEKVRPAAARHKAGAARGQRDVDPNRPAFKVKPGGPVVDSSWLSSIPMRVWLGVVMAFFAFARIGCALDHGSSTPSASDPGVPLYDSKHPPPWEKK